MNDRPKDELVERLEEMVRERDELGLDDGRLLRIRAADLRAVLARLREPCPACHGRGMEEGEVREEGVESWAVPCPSCGATEPIGREALNDVAHVANALNPDDPPATHAIGHLRDRLWDALEVLAHGSHDWPLAPSEDGSEGGGSVYINAPLCPDCKARHYGPCPAPPAGESRKTDTSADLSVKRDTEERWLCGNGGVPETDAEIAARLSHLARCLERGGVLTWGGQPREDAAVAVRRAIARLAEKAPPAGESRKTDTSADLSVKRDTEKAPPAGERVEVGTVSVQPKSKGGVSVRFTEHVPIGDYPVMGVRESEHGVRAPTTEEGEDGAS